MATFDEVVESLRVMVNRQGGDGVGPAPTVREVVEGYWADCDARVARGVLNVTTARQYRHKGMPPEAVADAPCLQLTPEAVEEWLASRGDWLPITKRDHARVLRQALRWAVRRKVIARDPLDGWKLPVGRARRRPLPESDQLAKLMAACPPCLAELLSFLRDTGCRVGEARAIEAKHLEGDLITLDKHKTERTGRERVIVLPSPWPARLAELAQRHPDGPLLRNCYGKPWQDAAVSQAVKRARRRAGLPESMLARLLRHRWATLACESGADVLAVAQQLGHSSPRITLEVYARARLGHVRNVVQNVVTHTP
jgi:integrase